MVENYKDILDSVNSALGNHVKKIVDNIIKSYILNLDTCDRLNSITNNNSIKNTKNEINDLNMKNELYDIRSFSVQMGNKIDDIQKEVYGVLTEIKISLDKLSEDISKYKEKEKDDNTPPNCNTNIENIKLEFNEIDKSIDDEDSDINTELVVKEEEEEEEEEIKKVATDSDYDEEEEEEEEEEEQEDDEEEDELFEIEINGVNYCTSDEKNGDIYELDENDEPGKKVGAFRNGKAKLN